jgi:phage terminase large subunit-like protein
MPTAIAQPLQTNDQKKLVALLMEIKSRGIEMPKDYQNLLNPEPSKDVKWKLGGNGYFLRDDGRQYRPAPQQKSFISSTARFVLARAGRGSGKSGAGSQKAMFKIMQGEDGAVINPIFSDFKTSTWPEFKRWIDWNMVVPSQRHRKSDAWEPHQPFTMVFINGAKVYCKGLKDPKSARGANINWLWYDEAASDLTGMSWRIAIASVRVGKNPQAWATTTPKGKEHWIYKFFIEKDIPQEAVDLLAKDDRILIESFNWSIVDNKDNLDPDYYASVISAFPSGWLRAQEVDGEFADEGGKVGDRRWFDEKIRNEKPEQVAKRLSRN